MSREIPDDPSVVQPIFQELRTNFYSHQTKPLAFRKQALKRLLEGYTALEQEFNQALKKDLGHNAFICNFGAHGITKAEIKDLIDGVGSWIKPEKVSTPLGTASVNQDWESPPARQNTSPQAWPWFCPPGITPFIQPSPKWPQRSPQETASY